MFLGYVFQLCWRRTAIIGGLMSIAIFQVTAVESPATKVLVGHKPTVSEIVMTPATPSAGENVTVSWKYSDLDNDAEADSLVRWFVAGQQVHEGTEKSYKLPDNSGKKSLKVAVQPASSPPAYPKLGDLKETATTTIGMALCKEGTYGKVKDQEGWKIYCPVNKTPVTLSEAVSACEAQGKVWGALKTGLLPMWEHMSNFAQVNKDICTNLGWPLRGRCGGADVAAADYYWGRESVGNPFYDYYVDATTGDQYQVTKSSTRKALFTCWIY